LWSELENGHGEFSPYKHTIIVKPAERLSYLVSADTPGHWAYHCHLLYHMESGMFRTVMTGVHIGALTLASVPAIGMDLSDMISQKQMPHVAGTLAYPAFKDRILQLDFAAHKLRVSDVLTGPVKCTGACDTMALVTFGKDGPPILVADGFEINEVKVSAQVDTMYTGSLLVYTASIEKLSLSGAARLRICDCFLRPTVGMMRVAEAQQEGFNGTILAKGRGCLLPIETVRTDGLFDATVGLELFFVTQHFDFPT
jgi:hypothetical protein